MPAMPPNTKTTSSITDNEYAEMRRTKEPLFEVKAAAASISSVSSRQQDNNNNNRPASDMLAQAAAAAAVSGTGTGSGTASNRSSTSQPASAGSRSSSIPGATPSKRSALDFRFGKTIGEGSFSTVFLAKDIHTSKEYAIKVCGKSQILKEKKQEYIKREREVMNVMTGCPGFVNLFCTFQDTKSLYFVMTYAKNGDLLPYINKVGSFDIPCTRFYAAELVLALENMHKRGIIHRDLKPENILLNNEMHTLIADFGSSKILQEVSHQKSAITTTGGESSATGSFGGRGLTHGDRKNSFVGTAQYVSPEILKGHESTPAIDLWALGCIIYQMVSGLPPFRGGSEYLIFQMILKQELKFPDGFDRDAKDLVERLLVLEPSKRLGAGEKDRYDSIRTHAFFKGVDWERLHEQTPPQIFPYLPGRSSEEELRSEYRVPDHLEPGLDGRQLTRLLGMELGTLDMGEDYDYEATPQGRVPGPKSIADMSEKERQDRLKKQKTESEWNVFADGEVILKYGYVNKRKGLFSRKRMLLLTTGPRLIYIDPTQMVKKGEIPWSPNLRVEPKNFKVFFVHTPKRTYYLDDAGGFALKWRDAIEDVFRFTYNGVAAEDLKSLERQTSADQDSTKSNSSGSSSSRRPTTYIST